MTASAAKAYCLAGSMLALALGGAAAGDAATHREVEPVAARASTAPTILVAVAQEHPGRQPFRQFCAPCHGERGRGDGPAAAALNPRPADFTDPEGLPQMTDDELIEVITGGRGFMPAWGPILTEQQVARLVAYVRELSRRDG